jgi:hypothetical protein
MTPRTRTRVEPAPLLLLRHPTGDGSSPRPMTPEERQYLRERKRLERLNQEAYLRSVTSTPASQRPVLEEAGDAVAHSAAEVLGSWGAGTVPAPAVPAAISPPPAKGVGLAKNSSKKLSPLQLHGPTRADQAHRGVRALAEERERSWIDVLRHDKANEHGGGDHPSLLRDVSSALTAIVPEPSTAQAETDGISSPIRPPSISGLGLPSPYRVLACPSPGETFRVQVARSQWGSRVAGSQA